MSAYPALLYKLILSILFSSAIAWRVNQRVASEFKPFAEAARQPNPENVTGLLECGANLKECCIVLQRMVHTQHREPPVSDELVHGVGAWLQGYNSVRFICCELAEGQDAKGLIPSCSGPYKMACPIDTDAIIAEVPLGAPNKNSDLLYTTTSHCVKHKVVVTNIIRGDFTSCLDVPAIDLKDKSENIYIYLWFTSSSKTPEAVIATWAKVTLKGTDTPLKYNEKEKYLIWGPAIPGTAYMGCIHTKPGAWTVLHIRLGGQNPDF